MTNNRDNFSKSTTEILAKRVGYLCSNPNCRNLTIGANENTEKTTSIGIASHITAASSKGPRYDDDLTKEQRTHIDNGIWLCGNCSILIDKDLNQFTVELLKTWKRDAEEETRQKLNGEYIKQPNGIPFLEIDLIWSFGGRYNQGYSNKNPLVEYEGHMVYMLPSNPIIHWEMDWHYNFVIYNNSNFPAYNILVESIGKVHFSSLDKLPKINNLPPLKNIDLKAEYKDYIEGDYAIADEILKPRIPDKFNDLTLSVKYYDDKRNEHITYVMFKNGEIINRKL